jgi:molybdate/tungstate transport system substrate-binding protein
MQQGIFKLLLAAIILFSLNGCNQSTQDKKLIIFHAGSLSVPFKGAIKAFNKLHPEVKVLAEAAGSRACARKITDINRKCDIMASADYTVINQLLIPEHTDWSIKFASNEMVIVYNDKSRCANEINSSNWYNILLKEDISYGRSDPNSDPCGYRTVLVAQLAEKYYGINGFSNKLLTKDLKYIRPKETDLLALLETPILDYVFIYRSIAKQHGLKYILLPDQVNLKKTEFADVYKEAIVKISGKKPGEFITKKGEPMVYGITILKNAPHKETALQFVDFLLSDKGMKIMEQNGQPSLIPSISETYFNIPDVLKKYASEKMKNEK